MLQRLCTNNALHPLLQAGNAVLGTRHQCLQKGINVGLNLPVDPNFLGPFQPIDNTVIYCGDANILPPGYNRFGSLPQCLQKGVGVGKRQNAINQGAGPSPPSSPDNSPPSSPDTSDNSAPSSPDTSSSSSSDNSSPPSSPDNSAPSPDDIIPPQNHLSLIDRIKRFYSKYPRFLQFVFISIVALVLLYIFKPRFLLQEIGKENFETDDDKKNIKKQILWRKFFLLYIIIVFMLFLFIYIDT